MQPGEARLLAGLVAVTVVARAPFVGAYLANWDTVQYALGLVRFDVVQHQPHPPGSILYVALGRLLLPLAGEANRALSSISVVASAASTALVYAVGRRIFGRRIALIATALYGASPLAWYYGAVALPYGLEGALGLAAAGLCWYAAEERRPRAAFAAAVALATAGGARQTTLLLLLPLWLYAAWRAGRGVQVPLGGLPLMGLLCAAWLVPLLMLSGGPGRYVTASRQLNSLVSGLTVVARGRPHRARRPRRRAGRVQRRRLSALAPAWGDARGLSAAHIRDHDRHWHAVVAAVRSYAPQETVLVTGTAAAESFRHATYYLPEYLVLAVGFDRDGTLGVAFEGIAGHHTYARFMAGSSAELYRTLPASTRRLVLLDPSVAGLLPRAALEEVPLGRDDRLSAWPVPEAADGIRAITFPHALALE